MQQVEWKDIAIIKILIINSRYPKANQNKEASHRYEENHCKLASHLIGENHS